MNTPSEDLIGVNFKSKKLEKRLSKTMDSLTEQPGRSILGATGNRYQAKAVYNMLSNKRFEIEEIKRVYAKTTIERMKAGATVLLIQDTTTNNLNGHKKTEGMGYCDGYNRGMLTHSCIAITSEGTPLGVLSQKTYTREQQKDESQTKDSKRSRAIEKKENYRWLETIEDANKYIPATINAVNICDREGDFYEFYAKAAWLGHKILVRLVQNRLIQEHKKSLEYISSVPACGSVVVDIPRDTRNGLKARQATLEVSYTQITIPKPKARKEAHLPETITATAIHVIERCKNGTGDIEWFLLTTETVENFDDAVVIVQYYVQRWKIERFHYVLKEGCAVEKLQERTFERQAALVFLYSIVAIYIMALTYSARVDPDASCDIFFDDDEWKVLFCAANKTHQPPVTPYCVKEAARYLAILGSFASAPSDGEPGAKVIWQGLRVLFNLIQYRAFV
jgi:hypothetical protein